MKPAAFFLLLLISCNSGRALHLAAPRWLASTETAAASAAHSLSRRGFFPAMASTSLAVVVATSWQPLPGYARAPGSTDVEASLKQIKDAQEALLELRKNWASYTVIDSEGRAGDVDAARRILGGVNPQNLPNPSPLYKIGGAFRAVQTAAIEADDGSYLSRLKVEEFAEAGERIEDSIRKADYQFYGCAFAPGGSKQIQQLYDLAGEFTDRSLADFKLISSLLSEASGTSSPPPPQLPPPPPPATEPAAEPAAEKTGESRGEVQPASP